MYAVARKAVQIRGTCDYLVFGCMLGVPACRCCYTGWLKATEADASANTEQHCAGDSCLAIFLF